MSNQENDPSKSIGTGEGEVTPSVPRKRGLPLPESIFEAGERTIKYGVYGFLGGSILGLVNAGGSVRAANPAPTLQYEQIANSMGRSGSLVGLVIGSYTLTVQSLEYLQGRKDHVPQQAAGFGVAGYIVGGLKYSLMENTIDPVKFRYMPAIKGALTMSATGAIVVYMATKLLLDKNEPNHTARTLENKVTSFLFPPAKK